MELMHITASFGQGFPLQWSICISHRSPSKPATQSHQYLDFSLLDVRWLVGWRWRHIPLTHGEERQGSDTALISQRSPLNPFGQRHLKLFYCSFIISTVLLLKNMNQKYDSSPVGRRYFEQDLKLSVFWQWPPFWQGSPSHASQSSQISDSFGQYLLISDLLWTGWYFIFVSDEHPNV